MVKYPCFLYFFFFLVFYKRCFVENHTINDIEKAVEKIFQCNGKALDIKPVSLSFPSSVENNTQENEDIDQLDLFDGDGRQLEFDFFSNTKSLHKSTKDMKPSTRYPIYNYILLIDSGEPESFDENVQDV